MQSEGQSQIQSQSRYVRVGSQGSGSSHSQQRRKAALDWRSNLFTVFVGNLSRRVSKSAVWDSFCEYGVVVDVYIPRKSKYPHRAKTFAFVRFKTATEMLRAIEHGNDRRVDGWFIRVKKASYGWKDRENTVQKWKVKPAALPWMEKASYAFKDNSDHVSF